MPLPLEVVDAPFRSLKQPVLDTVRAVTARPDTVAVVLVPGIIAGSWWQDLLHNEHALYLGWLLRFKPWLVVSPVERGGGCKGGHPRSRGANKGSGSI
jgi:hypothetical protein